MGKLLVPDHITPRVQGEFAFISLTPPSPLGLPWRVAINSFSILLYRVAVCPSRISDKYAEALVIRSSRGS